MNTHLPKGTPFMPEELSLNSVDLASAWANLQAAGCSGYLRFDTAPQRRAYLFLQNGKPLRAFELRAGEARLNTPERLIELAGDGARTCSYLLSPRLAETLALGFAFHELHPGRKISQKELKGVLDELESGKQSGFVRFSVPGGEDVTVAFQSGEPVNESFVSSYGEVVCGREAITALFDGVHAQGAALHIYAESAAELASRVQQGEENLARTRFVTPKGASGFFASKDTAKVEGEFLRDWGLQPKGTVTLQVEDADGKLLGTVKAQGTPGKGEQMEVPAKILASWGVSESDRLAVFPARA